MSDRLELPCAAGCGASDKGIPAVEDKATKQLRSLQVHPYICLACWRKGWRSDAPQREGDPWRIYRDENAPQPAKRQ